MSGRRGIRLRECDLTLGSDTGDPEFMERQRAEQAAYERGRAEVLEQMKALEERVRVLEANQWPQWWQTSAARPCRVSATSQRGQRQECAQVRQ